MEPKNGRFNLKLFHAACFALENVSWAMSYCCFFYCLLWSFVMWMKRKTLILCQSFCHFFPVLISSYSDDNLLLVYVLLFSSNLSADIFTQVTSPVGKKRFIIAPEADLTNMKEEKGKRRGRRGKVGDVRGTTFPLANFVLSCGFFISHENTCAHL